MDDNLEYRKKRFKVEVTKGTDGEVRVAITHNGYQWQAVGLLPAEAETVITAIRGYLDATRNS